MCTLILFNQMIRDYPVILAENRDAHIKSVEIPPSIVSETPRIYAAIDKKSGGTWFGANEYGVAVGLTNLYSGPYAKKSTSSRGKLCLNALKESSAEKVSSYLEEEYEIGKYRRASVVSADKNDALLTICNDEVEVIDLDIGPRVITNYNLAYNPIRPREIDDMIDSVHRKDRAEELIGKSIISDSDDIENVVKSLKGIFTDHEKTVDDRGSGHKEYFTICCHGNEKLYPWRTTSSSIVAIAKDDVKNSRYFYCPGNPCKPENDYVDYSSIMAALPR